MAEPGNPGMQKLIDTVNKLHDAFVGSGLPFDLELPQIIVVGGQSAGKSSVLENFVGREFLPRGAGIVTRRPLVLQLIPSNTEYAVFLHQSGRTYKDFSAVRKEIEDETLRETGSSKGISSNPINLKIFSPHVLPLTLVDLPGLTRVAVGDQPPDIEMQIRNMVMHYARKENSIILAVSPANLDLANSEAMRVAIEVDPSGHRTIGVITKLDLMDEGTDARNILTNNLLPLKRGYVGVVNRSQKDINGRKDFNEALEAERQFFQRHPQYRDIADKMGTDHLQLVLNKELSRHIAETLPVIRQSIKKKLEYLKKEIGQMKDVSDELSARTAITGMLQEFASKVSVQLEGLSGSISIKELSGGARINRIFYDDFGRLLAIEKIPPDVLRREIKYAIQNIYGVRSAVFTPDMAFYATCINIIERCKEPMEQCIQLVADLLTDIVDKCAEVFSEYPMLRNEVKYLITNHIEDRVQKTKEPLLMHIDAEMAFLNIRHEDFVGERAARDVDDRNEQPGQEFIQSLNNVKLKLDTTSKVVQKGWLGLKRKSRFSCSNYWFVLTTEGFTCFKNDTEMNVVFSIHLNSKTVLKPHKKKPKITLYNSDGQHLHSTMETLELLCEDESDQKHWISCFKTASVVSEESEKKVGGEEGKKAILRQKNEVQEFSAECSSTESIQSNLKRLNRQSLRDFTKSAADPYVEKHIDTIMVMVESYLKIVRKTIRDITPKYIMLQLVTNTQRFVTSQLVTTLVLDNSAVALLKLDGDDMARMEDLKRTKAQAEQALAIIGDIRV